MEVISFLVVFCGPTYLFSPSFNEIAPALEVHCDHPPCPPRLKLDVKSGGLWEESKSKPCYAPFNSSCGEVQADFFQSYKEIGNRLDLT